MIARWSTRLAIMAALCFLVAVSSSYALQCSCNDDGLFSDCRWDGWTCEVPDNRGACYTMRKLLDDGSIEKTLKCVDLNLNPRLCDGSVNTETKVYECCSDADMCNENLHPLLPFEYATEASTEIISASSTESPASSSSIAVTPSSSLSTPQTSVMVTATPTVTGPLQCACSDPKTCPSQTCQTNYKCFRQEIVHEDGQHDTTMGCLYDRFGIDICSVVYNEPNKQLRCCDGQDFCNRDLVLGPLEFPSIAQQLEDTPTVQETTPSNAGQGDLTEDELFFIFTVIVVVITMVTVLTILILLAVVCLRYHRDRSRLERLTRLQRVKEVSPDNSIYTPFRTSYTV